MSVRGAEIDLSSIRVIQPHCPAEDKVRLYLAVGSKLTAVDVGLGEWEEIEKALEERA